MNGCPVCGYNVFVLTDDKPVKEKCKRCGHEEVWRPGDRTVKCVVFTKTIRKDQMGFTIKGHLAHRKCMIAYTAWEVSQEHPGISETESRILQTRRNLENLYRRLECGNQP